MHKGKFIVIDGIDGSGKGTQIKLLKRVLGKHTIFTHEPGGTPKAEEIRKILLERKKESPAPLADFFLFWAARRDHVEKVIIPALRAGKNVITDRFDSSTFAFQVCAEQVSELKSLFEVCRKIVLGKCMPDAYIILDMPAETAMKWRSKNPVKKAVFFDKKPLTYHKRARLGFKKFAGLTSSKVFFVNANRSSEEVHEEILSIVYDRHL
ncbi:MAG: dTMP kinase [bacterium]|nr:dTMP kinase [bacterium]